MDPAKPNEVESAESEAVEKLTVRDKRAIRRWLARWIEAAEAGHQRCKEAAKVDPSGISGKNATYWKNVASGLRWARGMCKE